MASFIKGGGGSGGSGTTSNLGVNPTANTVEITNSGGDNATVPAATTSAAGTLTAADKTRLDGLGNADLSSTTGASSFTIHSSTGTDAVIPAATASLAGAFTATDKTKLDGLGNADLSSTTGASSFTIHSSTGTDAVVPAATASLSGAFTAADKTKLDALASTSVFGGATSGQAGTSGSIPAPSAGEQHRVLNGGGSWVDDTTGVTPKLIPANESITWDLRSNPNSNIDRETALLKIGHDLTMGIGPDNNIAVQLYANIPTHIARPQTYGRASELSKTSYTNADAALAQDWGGCVARIPSGNGSISRSISGTNKFLQLSTGTTTSSADMVVLDWPNHRCTLASCKFLHFTIEIPDTEYCYIRFGLRKGSGNDVSNSVMLERIDAPGGGSTDDFNMRVRKADVSIVNGAADLYGAGSPTAKVGVTMGRGVAQSSSYSWAPYSAQSSDNNGVYNERLTPQDLSGTFDGTDNTFRPFIGIRTRSTGQNVRLRVHAFEFGFAN